MSVVLSVDIGTSSVRCTAYLRSDSLSLEQECNSLSIVAAGDEKTPGQPDASGRFHTYILLTAANKAVSKCLEALRRKGTYQVAAMGFDCFAMSLIGTDENGHAATPCYSYAERGPTTGLYARKMREMLRLRGDLTGAYQRTGTPVHAAYAAPTLLRLRHEEPDMLRHVRCWQTFTSFLLSVWTSKLRVPVSYSEASWTGLLNRRTFNWDEGLLRAIGMEPSMLAPVCDYDGVMSLQLSSEFARKWPELVGASFLLGFGDGAMANVGSKCVDTSRIAATIGTSAALRIVVPSDKVPQIPCGLWCYSIDREHSLLGGALTDGGSVYEWIADAVGSNCATSMETRVDEAPMPGAHGLTVLPFLSGERSPGWNDAASGAICGITRHTTGQHIARAMLEAVALRIAAVARLLAPHANPNAQILASGTALTTSPVWKHMIADALGRQLLIEAVPQATSRGVAVMACRALRARAGTPGAAAKLPLIAEPLSEGVASIEPDVERTEAFAKALVSQQAVYNIIFGRSWLAPKSERLQAILVAVALVAGTAAAAALGFAAGRSSRLADH